MGPSPAVQQQPGRNADGAVSVEVGRGIYYNVKCVQFGTESTGNKLSRSPSKMECVAGALHSWEGRSSASVKRLRGGADPCLCGLWVRAGEQLQVTRVGYAGPSQQVPLAVGEAQEAVLLIFQEKLEI